MGKHRVADTNRACCNKQGKAVVLTPAKPQLKIAARTEQPVIAMRNGLDGKFRVFENGHPIFAGRRLDYFLDFRLVRDASFPSRPCFNQAGEEISFDHQGGYERVDINPTPYTAPRPSKKLAQARSGGSSLSFTRKGDLPNCVTRPHHITWHSDEKVDYSWLEQVVPETEEPFWATELDKHDLFPLDPALAELLNNELMLLKAQAS
jgi:hypothetical protein